MRSDRRSQSPSSCLLGRRCCDHDRKSSCKWICFRRKRSSGWLGYESEPASPTAIPTSLKARCSARSRTGVSHVVFPGPLPTIAQTDRKAGRYKSRFRTGRVGSAFGIMTGVFALPPLYAFDCRLHSGGGSARQEQFMKCNAELSIALQTPSRPCLQQIDPSSRAPCGRIR